jgi:hypothetical protein
MREPARSVYISKPAMCSQGTSYGPCNSLVWLKIEPHTCGSHCGGVFFSLGLAQPDRKCAAGRDGWLPFVYMVTVRLAEAQPEQRCGCTSRVQCLSLIASAGLVGLAPSAGRCDMDGYLASPTAQACSRHHDAAPTNLIPPDTQCGRRPRIPPHTHSTTLSAMASAVFFLDLKGKVRAWGAWGKLRTDSCL